MDVAWCYTGQSTCSRLQVGAILVLDGRQIGQGWNGAPAGEDHCMHEADEPCEIAIHAEQNVIFNAAFNGSGRTAGATMFITHAPCHRCGGSIINAGIRRVVYGFPYRSTDGLARLENAGIEVCHLIDWWPPKLTAA